MDMKRFILIVLSCALLLTGLAGCGKQNKVIKEHAQAVAEAFADGDMAAINMLIFGIDELEVVANRMWFLMESCFIGYV